METLLEQLMELIDGEEVSPVEAIGALELAKHFVIANLDAEDEA